MHLPPLAGVGRHGGQDLPGDRFAVAAYAGEPELITDWIARAELDFPTLGPPTSQISDPAGSATAGSCGRDTLCSASAAIPDTPVWIAFPCRQ